MLLRHRPRGSRSILLVELIEIRHSESLSLLLREHMFVVETESEQISAILLL
jgi:hypothetical protein